MLTDLVCAISSRPFAFRVPDHRSILSSTTGLSRRAPTGRLALYRLRQTPPSVPSGFLSPPGNWDDLDPHIEYTAIGITTVSSQRLSNTPSRIRKSPGFVTRLVFRYFEHHLRVYASGERGIALVLIVAMNRLHQ